METVGGITCKDHNTKARVVRHEDGSHTAECFAGHSWPLKEWLPGPLPSWLRARFAEARHGGTDSYSRVGAQFMDQIDDFVDDDQDDLVSLFEGGPLSRLEKIVEGESDEDLIAWLNEQVPRVMRLVPTRRLRSFLDGCREALQERVFE